MAAASKNNQTAIAQTQEQMNMSAIAEVDGLVLSNRTILLNALSVELDGLRPHNSAQLHHAIPLNLEALGALIGRLFLHKSL